MKLLHYFSILETAATSSAIREPNAWGRHCWHERSPMTFPKTNIVLLLQEAMINMVEKATQTKQWRMDLGGNEGLSLDFQQGLKQCQDKLQLLKTVVTEQQLEIQVT